MGYARDLLAAAAAKAGSRYALAQITGIDESDLSKAARGKRGVPASWILPLARVAKIDPTEAMEFWDLERAEKKRSGRLSRFSGPDGAAETSPTSDDSGNALPRFPRTAFDRLHIVSISTLSDYHLSFAAQDRIQLSAQPLHTAQQIPRRFLPTCQTRRYHHRPISIQRLAP